MENPWRHFSFEQPNYILPIDSSEIFYHNARYARRPNYKIETKLFPEPFVGNPEAPIYLLSHNPKLSLTHNFTNVANADFQQIILNNLTHQLADQPNPFYIISQPMKELHPEGYKWWSSVLKELIDESANA